MLTDPKTTRACPKQTPDQTEEQYKKAVEEWVQENSDGWQGQDGDVNCWTWKGAFAPHSGGARYNNFAAHSFIFRLLRDPNYQGNLLRRCRNKNCVNPDHAYPAVGKRTKQKQEMKRIVEQGEIVLKEEGRREVIEGIKGGVMEEVERVVKTEVRKMEREIVEGVVAKLIEIRFDRLVGEEVIKQMRGGK